MDIERMTPEDFVALMRRDDDAQVRATLDEVGTGAVLDQVFANMADRFLPERAGDRTATVQWRIDDRGEEHRYVVRLAAGTCTTERGSVDGADATIRIEVVRFLRVAAGQRNPTKLLLTRKLKVAGDVLLAKQLDGFFDIPS
jgi:alkyl sulfatase BDS1-like metallo-beta-lactamase superfamily hydrolase